MGTFIVTIKKGTNKTYKKLVEEVAKAIHNKAKKLEPGVQQKEFEEMLPENQAFWKELAKAALEAQGIKERA